jgi:hypothetical protein
MRAENYIFQAFLGVCLGAAGSVPAHAQLSDFQLGTMNIQTGMNGNVGRAPISIPTLP